jgi:hypothetical protein
VAHAPWRGYRVNRLKDADRRTCPARAAAAPFLDRVRQSRSALAEQSGNAQTAYFLPQNRDVVSGGLAVSSIAQNGTDQTKSAARAIRARSPSPSNEG